MDEEKKIAFPKKIFKKIPKVQGEKVMKVPFIFPLDKSADLTIGVSRRPPPDSKTVFHFEIRALEVCQKHFRKLDNYLISNSKATF